jgi:hypothetical protein
VQSAPLTVAFTGSTSGGVSWHWDFGDGTSSTEPDPRHTYARVGSYDAKLTVTYADGESAVVDVPVQITCTIPDGRDTVHVGDADTGVPNHDLGGCTINDLINDEGEWDGRDAFMEHVNTVLNQLQADGVITGKEKGAVTRTAARSDVGKPGSSGYRWIFDGTAESLDGWRQAPGGSFQLQDDGSLRSQGGLGMFWYAAEEFEDFSLKLEFQDIAPGSTRANSGVFVRFPDPRTPQEERPECGSATGAEAWVAIYCGHEIQIYDGQSGEPQKTGSVYNFDPVGLGDAGATAKGVWNEYEIRVVGQKYTIIRNGVVINEFENSPGKQSSRGGDPSTDLRQFLSGFVGLQNHGNNDLIEFRNIRVMDL